MTKVTAMSQTAPCGHEDGGGVDSELLRTLGLSCPELHGAAASLAVYAAALRKKRNTAFCLLPLCCTVEAETLGANITMGDATSGPRAGTPVCSSLEEINDRLAMGFNPLPGGRMAAVLDACAMLRATGEEIALELSGPFTVLGGMAEFSTVLKGWRKNETLFLCTLENISACLLAYARLALERNVTVLSYADPSGTSQILGPVRFEFMTRYFTLPFLRRLLAVTADRAAVHVCPKTSHQLVHLGHAEWREKALLETENYAAACLAASDGLFCMGRRCIKVPRNDAERVVEGFILVPEGGA